MNGQTIILSGRSAVERAKQLLHQAPRNSVCNIAAPRRTSDQNSRFWALLSDVSRSKPGGRAMTPERWKAVFMQSFGHQVQFENDLDGRPFPVGHSSSRLSKQDMSDLMEFISAWGSENGVVWTEPQQ